MKSPVDLDEIRTLLSRAYIAAPGTRLRVEDEKKCRELVGLLSEVAAAMVRMGHRDRPLRLVDAAAGKGYVGLAVAALLARVIARDVRVTFIEREPRRAEAIREVCSALGLGSGSVEVRRSDVAEGASWPDEPDLVVGLHACGDATDRILQGAARVRARWILVAPCCVASWLPAAQTATRLAETLGLPGHAEVRRRYLEAHVLAERVWALEAAGWETETVPFVPSTVTPYNVVLRARRVGEPNRMRAARESLRRLQGQLPA